MLRCSAGLKLYENFFPGYVEVVAGHSGIGKTRYYFEKIKKLQIPESWYLVFDPVENERSSTHTLVREDEKLVNAFPCIKINGKNPKEILEKIAENKAKNIDPYFVIIDEGQFFSKDLVKIAFQLARTEKFHVIVAGVDIDYRGEPFGPMGELIARADIRTNLEPFKCHLEDCFAKSSRIQAIQNGAPLPWVDDLGEISKFISFEGEETRTGITFHPCCPTHLEVPGKPEF